jgi:hypothetical protein
VQIGEAGTIPEQGVWVKQVVRGFFGYNAVPTKGAALRAFHYFVKRIGCARRVGVARRTVSRGNECTAWPDFRKWSDSEVAECPDDSAFWGTPDSLCSPRGCLPPRPGAILLVERKTGLTAFP